MLSSKMTTIPVSKKTRELLDELKAYPGEPLGSVIKRIAENCIDWEPLSKEEIDGIKIGLKDIEEGRTYSTEEVKKKAGI